MPVLPISFRSSTGRDNMSTATGTQQETADLTNEIAQCRGTIRADYLRELVAITGAVAPEAKVRVGPDGELSLAVIDGSHVAMVTWDMPAEAWDSVTVTQRGDLVIDPKKIMAALKSIKGTTLVGVEAVGEKLVITGDSGIQELALGNPAGINWPKVPTVTPTICLSASFGELAESVRQSGRVSDHVYLVAYAGSPCQLWVKAEGKKDKLGFRVPVGESDWGTATEAKVPALYPLDLFVPMMKALPKSVQWQGHDGYVNLAYGVSYPLRLEFAVTGGLTRGTFLLAPRVPEETGETHDPDGPDWVPPTVATPAPAPGPTAPKPRRAPRTAAVPAAAPPAPVVAVVTAPAAVVPLPPAPAPEIRDDVPTLPKSEGVRVETPAQEPTREELLRLIKALAIWDKSMGYWDSEVWIEVRRIAGVPTNPRHTKEPTGQHVVGAW